MLYRFHYYYCYCYCYYCCWYKDNNNYYYYYYIVLLLMLSLSVPTSGPSPYPDEYSLHSNIVFHVPRLLKWMLLLDFLIIFYMHFILLLLHILFISSSWFYDLFLDLYRGHFFDISLSKCHLFLLSNIHSSCLDQLILVDLITLTHTPTPIYLRVLTFIILIIFHKAFTISFTVLHQ